LDQKGGRRIGGRILWNDLGNGKWICYGMLGASIGFTEKIKK